MAGREFRFDALLSPLYREGQAMSVILTKSPRLRACRDTFESNLHRIAYLQSDFLLRRVLLALHRLVLSPDLFPEN
jgi:hypothetical protein